MQDTYKHKGLRRKLVESLKKKGLQDESVIAAMMEVPRHSFMDSAFIEHAYEDKAFPISAGQTISQPLTVANQTQLLDVRPGMKVLEIGTGSGYQAAVLISIGVRLFSIERQRKLYNQSKRLLGVMGYKAELYYGDGYKGKPQFAPFDRIIVTCGAPFVPEQLVDQLALGGIMVVPIGEGRTQIMKKLIKDAQGIIHEEEHGIYSFVPMLKEKNR